MSLKYYVIDSCASFDEIRAEVEKRHPEFKIQKTDKQDIEGKRFEDISKGEEWDPTKQYLLKYDNQKSHRCIFHLHFGRDEPELDFVKVYGVNLMEEREYGFKILWMFLTEFIGINLVEEEDLHII